MSCSKKTTKEWLESNNYIDSNGKVLKSLGPAISAIKRSGRKKNNGVLPEMVNHNDIIYKNKNGKIGYFMPFFDWVDKKNNETFSSRREVSNDVSQLNLNLRNPVGDNYRDFLNHKIAQKEVIEDKINRAKQEVRNSDTSENRAKVKKLEEKEKVLSNQIEMLQENQIDYMFHAIIDDLNEVEDKLREADIREIQEVRDNIDYYFDFIGTIDSTEPEYSEIASKIVSSRKLYEDIIKDKVIKSLEDSQLVQNTLASMSEEFGREVTIDELMKANKDISYFDQQFLGLISSTTGDTVLPQHLMELFRKSFAKNLEKVNKINDRLDEFNKKNPNVDREQLFELDKDGNKTGNLKDIYSNKWFESTKLLRTRLGHFYKADANQKQNSYNKIIDWYNYNSNVIDFTKLKIVKDLYEPQYSSHFTSTNQQMDDYEKELKDLLGPRYNDTIEKLLNKLKKFEEFKNESDQTDPFYNKNVAQRDLWSFLSQYNRGEGKKGIAYNYNNGQNQARALFSHFGDLPVVPKTGKEFYSEGFKELRESPEVVELWTIYKDMSQHINSTYGVDSMGRISYPKIQIQYAEMLDQQINSLARGLNTKSLSEFGKLFTKAGHAMKSMFYERGTDKREEDTIRANYTDNTKAEIFELKQLYGLQGMNEQEASEKARAEVMKKYSTDLDRNFKAIMIQTAMHDARIETQPIAKSILEVFSGITDAKGLERKRAISRLTEYVDKIVLNKSVKERNSGSAAGKDLTRRLGKDGLEEKWFGKGLNIIGDTQFGRFFNINASKMRLLSDTEKLLLNEMDNISVDNNKELFVVDGSLRLKKIQTDNGFKYTINDAEISQENFEKALDKYFKRRMTELGTDINFAGIVDGYIKTTIVKYLGLNPISGIFNRIEGMFSTMIMDATGEYWTPGNADTAKEFLAFANTVNMSKKRFKLNSSKVEQLEIMDKLLARMHVLQDRKNELQRNTDDAKFSLSNLNIFKWAVDAPEYKNQGTVILSVLMDKEIQDNEGNTYKFFDGESFPAFEIKDGVLNIKDNFSESFSLDSDAMLDTILQLETTVSKVQGNYNNLDIMLAKKSWFGRAAMLFKTWMAESLNKRWGSSSFNGDINTNLFNSSQRGDGYMLKGLSTNPVAFATYLAGVLGVSYGALGLAGLVGGGVLTAYVIKKSIGTFANKESINRDVINIREMINFLHSVAIESVNMPSRLGSTIPGVKKLRVGDNSFSNTNLSPKDVGATKALARELAVMLTMLSLKIAMAALLYDEEDDKEDFRRKMHNMVQNQLSRGITTLSVYSDPQAITNDAKNFVLGQTLTQLYNATGLLMADNDPEAAAKEFVQALPVPSTITKLVTKGQTPLESNYNYDFINFNKTKFDPPMRWISKKMETSKEEAIRSEMKQIRSEYRKEVKKKYPNKGKKFIEKKVNRKYPPKQKHQSYEVTLNKYKRTQKNSE